MSEPEIVRCELIAGGPRPPGSSSQPAGVLEYELVIVTSDKIHKLRSPDELSSESSHHLT